MIIGVATADDLLSRDFRLDASYHASSSQQANKDLSFSGKKLEHLSELCVSNGIYIPGRFKRIFVENSKNGAPYLTGSSIMQAEPFQGAKLLSYRYTANMDHLMLHEKMILVTCSGEIGNVVYVNGTFQGAVGSPDLIRIVANPAKILSGYLFAYLSSPMARTLIRQKTYGAVIPHIEAHHIFDLPIPRLDPAQEEHIHQLIEQAADLRVKANLIKQKAERKTSELLGVDLSEKATKIKLVSVQNQKLNDRFEASYHAAQVTASIFTTSNFPLIQIGSLLERIFYLGKLHRVFVNDARTGITLLSISDAQKAKLTSDKYISKTLSRNIKDAMLERGWVLVSRVGTPGIVIYTRREMEGMAGTDHLVRLIPKNDQLLPGYLFSLLSSPVGNKLLIGSAHGSVQLVLPPEYIVLINIPLPPLQAQKDVHNLIEQYAEALTQASQLEDQAQDILISRLGLLKEQAVME